MLAELSRLSQQYVLLLFVICDISMHSFNSLSMVTIRAKAKIKSSQNCHIVILYSTKATTHKLHNFQINILRYHFRTLR